MANWKNTLKVKDLFEAYKAGNLDPHTLGNKVADRLLKLKDLDDPFPHGVSLREIADNLREVDTINNFDCVLSDLYDWGDYDHRLWIESL